MNQERLEHLELKVAYLERANHELSDVVYRQQRELEDLRMRLINLASRLSEASGQRVYSEEEERPPHY